MELFGLGFWFGILVLPYFDCFGCLGLCLTLFGCVVVYGVRVLYFNSFVQLVRYEFKYYYTR